MRSAYKFLAYAVDALILLQAAAIAWAVFGLTAWIEDGNSLSTSTMESDETPFPEVAGFIVHGISGTLVVPLVALVLLVVSFLAHVPKGVAYAGMVFGGVVVQVALGIFAHGLPFLGFVHGFWALLIFAVAFRAARQADTTTPDAVAAEAVAAR
ncbi:hypothetical protein ASG49_13560 [Marmoricola sp. Leaf446]|uniref:hypothetical protein n=1 Tax=Marmoricola sp. Leaf446 TaxID=1736379 RepID=UPI0006FE585C|nr:hypothetical protein [Marmoricola sp. Leaf446]KQT90768.1 hypothetical protein ASG49_13560 [Marmoricola sp. Leaf446]